MVTSKHLQALLVIPTVVSVCFVFVHLSKQNIFTDVSPRAGSKSKETEKEGRKDDAMPREDVSKNDSKKRLEQDITQMEQSKLPVNALQEGEQDIDINTSLLDLADNDADRQMITHTKSQAKQDTSLELSYVTSLGTSLDTSRDKSPSTSYGTSLSTPHKAPDGKQLDKLNDKSHDKSPDTSIFTTNFTNFPDLESSIVSNRGDRHDMQPSSKVMPIETHAKSTRKYSVNNFDNDTVAVTQLSETLALRLNISDHVHLFKTDSPTSDVNKVSKKPREEENILSDITCEDASVKNLSNFTLSISDKKCIPYYKFLDICAAAKKYYPSKNMRYTGKCETKTDGRICSIVSFTRTGRSTEILFNCSMAVCENGTVSVAIVDHEYGLVRKQKLYHDLDNLEHEVQKAIEKSLRHKFDFIFLGCKANNARERTKVEQILFLPAMKLESERTVGKRKKKKPISRSSQPNINVIVLDSISRAHFPRVFPRTVLTMREAKNSKQGVSTSDFKYFQSLAPFTFVNVKSFMTGTQEFSSVKDRDIGFDVLFKSLKGYGYQTMVQEDTCWYDKWGTILSSNKKHDSSLENLDEIKHGWKEFNRITSRYGITSFGLTHMSCYVLKKYGRTNMFNKGPSFCYDGKPLSAHFLEYATEAHKQQELDTKTRPQFTYTHINIAHESSGKRACVLDEYLAKTVSDMYKLNNTVTIIWSDHGAKTSSYSIDALTGKFETHDSFLFFIVPEKTKKEIGKDRFGVFLKNQKSVVSAVDLHKSVLFLSQIGKRSDMKNDLGLFTDKAWREGCSNLPIRSYSLCKCVNTYTFPDLKSRLTYYDILWMAEFALGLLNDKLNKQLSNIKRNIEERRCQWLRGWSFRNVIYESDASSSLNRYIFDILVVHRKMQVFNVQIRKSNSTLSLFHWQRSSIYMNFDSCKDRSVSLELCVCSKSRDYSKFDMRAMMAMGMFGRENRVTYLIKDEQCLLLVERNHDMEVVSFSVANICDKDYNLQFLELEREGWETSNHFPLKITAIANSISFITAARRRSEKFRIFQLMANIVNNSNMY